MIPILIEVSILTSISLMNEPSIVFYTKLVTCLLLFAMGLQNALVTKISNSVVRTTHLTGLFTDLGIEISQLFFYKELEQKRKLIESIKLRFIIISFFFLGCVIGGYLYLYLKMRVLLIASSCLLIGLFYDYAKLRLVYLKRKYIDPH
jgi:uncharacterized membrane protein YoaK (UPF0700 family)